MCIKNNLKDYLLKKKEYEEKKNVDIFWILIKIKSIKIKELI